MKPHPTCKLTRRQILAATATALPAVSLLSLGAVSPSKATTKPARSSSHRYCFFDATEARFIEAACERLIPADSSGPGARDAAVPEYLDRHLADAWGSGQRLYRRGPWQPGTPSERRQPFKPAELFRAALTAIHLDLSHRGTSFAELPTAAQESYLAALEAGAPLPGVATAAFFDLLLLMTTEGFFANAALASRRDRLAWPLRGFPGAYASPVAFGAGARRQEAAGDIP